MDLPYYQLTRSLDRIQKLKDARSEASKEIEEYKKSKETEFKAFEASVRNSLFPYSCTISLVPQHAGTTSEAQAAVDQETEVKLKSITDSYNSHKDVVVQKLLDRVVLVTPELHRNLKKVGA